MEISREEIKHKCDENKKIMDKLTEAHQDIIRSGGNILTLLEVVTIDKNNTEKGKSSGYIALSNLTINQLDDITSAFMRFVKQVVENNPCNCKKCKKIVKKYKELLNEKK